MSGTEPPKPAPKPAPRRRKAAPAQSTRPANLAHGRWLGDFPDLSPFELQLVADCAAGVPCGAEGYEWGDPLRPTEENDGNRIRGGLIRFLLLGGDVEHPVHELAVTLCGAWIVGDLNLRHAQCDRHLNLWHCHFEVAPILVSARLTELALSGCSMPALNADGIVVKGDVFLDHGFSASGKVRLVGAQIGGSLACGGGTFAATRDKDGEARGDALSADRIVVKGSIFLNHSFSASGKVRLVGAQIGGSLACSGGTFATTVDKDGEARGDALSADGIVVKGSILLDHGFSASGKVRLLGAQIGGILACSGGTFAATVDKDGEARGDALSADGIVVKGSLMVRGSKVSGPISLANAKCDGLIDRGFVWPDGLTLDGFDYNRISDGPTDAKTRIAWLHKQQARFLTKEHFCPQPWEQLTHVLRKTGHTAAATEVAIAKQRAMRSAEQIGVREPNPRYTGRRLTIDRWWVDAGNRLSRGWHRAYGLIAGYGHRPADIIAWMVGLWLFFAIFYGFAAWGGIMAPASADVIMHEQLHSDIGADSHDSSRCGIRYEVNPPQYWPACAALPSEYTTFNPAVYSLDLILPLVDLGQESSWAPSATYTDSGGEMQWLWWGMGIRALMWFEILFGWFASLMFVAIVSRLVDKD